MGVGEDFGIGLRRGPVSLMNLTRGLQGYDTVDPNLDIAGTLSQHTWGGQPQERLAEATTPGGRIAQGVGEQVLPMGLLAPLAAAGGMGGMGIDALLNMLGATAGETAREQGAGGLGQMIADVGTSVTPAALGRRLATSGAKQATGDALEHLKYLGKNKARAMRGLHDESTNYGTKYQRQARQWGEGNAEDVRQLVQATGGIMPASSASDAMRPSPFERRAVDASVQPDLYGGKTIAEFELPGAEQARFNDLGIPTPKMLEIEDPTRFHELISASKESTKFGPSVHVYDVDEYADMRTFVTEDGTAGIALKPDGDMVSGFSVANGPHKGVVPYMIAMATSEGGTKADAFNIGGVLPRIYGDSGLDLKAYDEWDPQYRPDDWDDALGTPDVVYLEQAPANAPLPAPSYNPGAHGVSPVPRAGIRAADKQRREPNKSVSGLGPLLPPT
jgi:hypothetical protein